MLAENSRARVVNPAFRWVARSRCHAVLLRRPQHPCAISLSANDCAGSGRDRVATYRWPTWRLEDCARRQHRTIPKTDSAIATVSNQFALAAFYLSSASLDGFVLGSMHRDLFPVLSYPPSVCSGCDVDDLDLCHDSNPTGSRSYIARDTDIWRRSAASIDKPIAFVPMCCAVIPPGEIPIASTRWRHDLSATSALRRFY